MTTIARKILDEAEVTGIHPLADAFPLLGDEELNELADDIRENGLKVPIVVSPAGLLLDGRNRLIACHLAGVAPSFRTDDGDPTTLIVSLNLKRRNLTQLQRALLVIKSEQGNGTLGSIGTEGAPVPAHIARLSGAQANSAGHAVLIWRYCPEYVDALIAGLPGLRVAEVLEQARQLQQDEETEREQRDAGARKEAAQRAAETRAQLERQKADAAKLVVLRQTHPELAAQVDAGTLPLDAALAAKREQARLEREETEASSESFAHVLTMLLAGRDVPVEEAARYKCAHLDLTYPRLAGVLTVANLDRCLVYLSLIQAWLAKEETRGGATE